MLFVKKRQLNEIILKFIDDNNLQSNKFLINNDSFKVARNFYFISYNTLIRSVIEKYLDESIISKIISDIQLKKF